MQKRKKRYRLKKSVKISAAFFLIALVAIFSFLLLRNEAEDTGPDYGKIHAMQSGEEERGDNYDMAAHDFIVKVFDVGQGSCMLIDYQDTEVLIDGGYYNEKNIHTLLKSKTGLSKYVTDGKIEYIIATHSDADHIGCLPEVIEAYKVGKIIYGDLLSENASVDYLIAAAKEKNVPMVEDSDTVISLGKNASLTIFDVCDGDAENINNNSIVTLIQYGETYFFASGDLPSEKEVLLRGKLPECDVVIAGHHGSSSSNSLLSELSPQYFIISCGKAAKKGTKQANVYGFPHKEVLQAAEDGAECFGTWKSGNIVLTSDGMTVSCSAKAKDELTEEDAGAEK